MTSSGNYRAFHGYLSFAETPSVSLFTHKRLLPKLFTARPSLKTTTSSGLARLLKLSESWSGRKCRRMEFLLHAGRSKQQRQTSCGQPRVYSEAMTEFTTAVATQRHASEAPIIALHQRVVKPSLQSLFEVR